MNAGEIMIDQITNIVLNCVDTEGNKLDIAYDVSGADVSVMIGNRTFPPEINIKGRLNAFTVSNNEYVTIEVNDDLSECSSEELDGFLEQFIKE